MPQTRKTVRDALVSVLSNATRGFSVKLAAIAATYAIDPFTIDWSSQSSSLFQGYLTSADVEVGQLAPEAACPVGVLIYTTTSVGMALQKPSTFSGEVGAVVDFYIRFREGIEQDNIESICDAIEDAALEALYDNAAAWPPSITLSANVTVPKEPAELTGDGWQQRIPIILLFEVTV